MATGVGDIFLDLKLNKQPFERGLNETKAMGSAVGRKIGLAIAGAIAGAVATVGFGHLVSETAKLGDAIDKTSQKMGMSAQTYQEWDFIMQRCGTSMESMTTAMKTLASSAETSKDALAELGISQEEVASMSQEQLFARTITALQNVEDTTRRTYLAGQLLGRGATELGAVLNMSAYETNELRNRVYELGGVMSQEAVTSSAMYSDALLDLRMAFRGISDTVATTVLPILTSAINKVIIPLVLRAVAVIRYFGNILRSAFGGLGKKIGGVFGKTSQKQNVSFGKSLGGISKGIGGAGKSAKKAKKAVKELNRELMGFDKMNKLAKKTKSSDSGGGGSAKGAGGVGGVSGGGIEPSGLDDANSKLGLFGKLSEKLRPIWKALGEVFSAVIRLFKALGVALAPVGKWIWTHLIKPFGKLLGMAIVAVLQGIAGAINLLALFVEKHPKLAVILMGIGTALFMIMKRGAIISFFKRFGKVFASIGSIFMKHPIAILLTAIALAIGYIYRNWDKIKKTKFGQFLIKVWEAIQPLVKELKTMADTIKRAVLRQVGRFGKWFDENKPKIKAFIATLAERMKPVLKVIGKVLATLAKGALKLFIAGIRMAWKIIKTVATVLWKAIKALKTFGSWLKNTFGKTILDKIQWVADKIKFLGDIWDKITGKKKNLKVETNAGTEEPKISKLKKSWDGVNTKTPKMTASVKDNASGTIGKTKTSGLRGRWNDVNTKNPKLTANVQDNATSKLGKTKDDGLRSAWRGVYEKDAKLTATVQDSATKTLGKTKKDGLRSRWGDVEKKDAKLTAHAENKNPDTLKTISNSFSKVPKEKKSKLTATANFKDQFKDKYNKLAEAIQKTRNKYPVTKLILPNIHPLAQGGWLKKNTPKLAIVGDNRHEGEIVSPESKLEAMARKVAQEASANSSNDQVVLLLTQLLRAVNGLDTNIYLDGKQIANSTVNQINQQTRTTGVSPLLV